jgi:hypothetical protein
MHLGRVIAVALLIAMACLLRGVLGGPSTTAAGASFDSSATVSPNPVWRRKHDNYQRHCKRIYYYDGSRRYRGLLFRRHKGVPAILG